MTSTLLNSSLDLTASFSSPSSTGPFISVIVPVRNEARHIQRTLMQVLAQHYNPKRFEVIVVDGQSTDGTWGIVAALQKQYDHLRLLANSKRWSSAARNAALRIARGDIVVVIDGHCHLDNSDYLTHLAHAFERSGADCVGRPQPLDVSGATVLQRAIALARSSPLGHHPESLIYSDVEQYVPPQSVAVAYRRQVFERVGCFDENFDACEDVEFNHRVARAGLTCFFTPRVQVRYEPRDSLGGLFRQMVRYGRGRYRLLRKHPDTFSIPCVLPAVFLCGLVIGPSFAWIFPGLLAGYLGGLGLYALTVLGCSLTLAWSARDLKLLLWLPPVFATIHAGAGAGLLQEVASECWSKINKAFGFTRPATAVVPRSPDRGTSAPVPRSGDHAPTSEEVLAWRTNVEDGRVNNEQSRDYPRSLAG